MGSRNSSGNCMQIRTGGVFFAKTESETSPVLINNKLTSHVSSVRMGRLVHSSVAYVPGKSESDCMVLRIWCFLCVAHTPSKKYTDTNARPHSTFHTFTNTCLREYS